MTEQNTRWRSNATMQQCNNATEVGEDDSLRNGCKVPMADEGLLESESNF